MTEQSEGQHLGGGQPAGGQEVPVRLLVVTAGLSAPSSTRLLADQVEAATRGALGARGREVETTVVEVRELATEITQALLGAGRQGPALARAQQAATQADAVIAVTPVFTASMSGLFKSFLDVLEPDTLAGTPVLMGATAGTERHSLVLDFAMRPVFTYMKAVVTPTGVFAATSDFGSPGLARRVERAGQELADLLSAQAGSAAYAGADSAGRASATASDPHRSAAVAEESFVPFDELLGRPT